MRSASPKFGSGYDYFYLNEYGAGSEVWSYTTSATGDSLSSYVITSTLNGSAVSAAAVGPGVDVSLSATVSELTSSTGMGIYTYQVKVT
jgi:hypothetical protein